MLQTSASALEVRTFQIQIKFALLSQRVAQLANNMPCSTFNANSAWMKTIKITTAKKYMQ
jgi:hypothetical protein